MYLKLNDDRPIFIQLAEGIEDGILSEAFLEESQIPSTTEISVNYKINPATALKGMNLLVDQGIIYKKRGVGMFVATGAVEKIFNKRKQSFFETYIEALYEESEKLKLSKDEIISMIERRFNHE